MASTPSSLKSVTLQYNGLQKTFEGSIVDLPAKLAGSVRFDTVELNGIPTSKRVTLWFRNGAKKIFHIKLVRKSGRCFVELGGLDAKFVLDGIEICKNHFDQWFGIDATDLSSK